MLIALILTILLSGLSWFVLFILTSLPRYIVVGDGVYGVFKSWKKASIFVKRQSAGEYQIFVCEKKEYSFVTAVRIN